MKSVLKKSISIFLLVCLLSGSLLGCRQNGTPADSTGSTVPSGSVAPSEPVIANPVDYAAQVHLNLNSETAKQEVTVKTFVDGDTTHFYVPVSVNPNGVMKARYLAINTPESTGRIEEYGKAASNFTREKLSSAESIIIESENETWNPDSTGSRFLAWVWYKPKGEKEYRNLNIEILQNGLAIANSTKQNRYGTTAMAALNQAKAQKLNIYSGQKDPDFYYGEAVELTLKELRLNLKKYEGMKVAFNGVVTVDGSNSVFVETKDPETGLYFGMGVYYGFNLPGAGLDILTVGNEVRIVGTVQYYEPADTYQVSGLTYRMMKPDDPNNIQKLSEGHKAAYVPTDAQQFAGGKVEIETEEGSKAFDYAALTMDTSIEMKNLHVKEIYTTNDPESASKGAMTITCETNGATVQIRTTVLADKDGNVITADAYEGKTIDVRGIVGHFGDDYQIRVFSADAITIK